MVSSMLGEQGDVTDLIVGLGESAPLDAMCLYYVLARQGKLEAAAKVLVEVTNAYPGFLAGLGKLGNLYLQSGQPALALDAFGECSARMPKNPWARLMPAKALSRAGQHDDAKKLTEAGAVFEKVLAAQPNHTTAPIRLSLVKLGLNQIDAGLVLAKRAVGLLGGGRGRASGGYRTRTWAARLRSRDRKLTRSPRSTKQPSSA
jgi:tetratricopeptide (TPR) repeat protein